MRPTPCALLLGLSIAGPAAAAPAPVTDAAAGAIGTLVRGPDWTPVFQGVERLAATVTGPRLQQVRALRVDLRAPGVDVLVTPSNGSAPKDVGARTTSEFLEEFGCQAAINGSAFDVLATERGAPQDILGLSLSRGDRYSPPNRWDALLISRDRKAWIARSPVQTGRAFNGLSGFYALLLNGRQRGGMADRHPRSAVGVTRDGRYLLLMTVDGRQPGYSEGASTAETAAWLHALGAYNALNLDGGGSTALVIEGADGQPELLNRPSGPPPGVERRVANHLCVFARKLENRKPR